MVEFSLQSLLIFLGICISLFLLKIYVRGASCSIQKDLSGRTAVITGGNTGLGYQTAKRLCELGCKVIIGARDQEKNKKAVSQIGKICKGYIISFKLDLSDRNSIQNFAQQVKLQLKEQNLDYLVNNAATIFVPERRLTKQGFQMHIGINHFGHFYLTFLLWPLLKNNSNPRIINVSSKPFDKQIKAFHLNLQDINFQNDKYTPLSGYARSKKANVIFTRQLQRRMNEKKFNGIALSIHPGPAITQCAREILNSSIRKFLFKLIQPILYFLMKSAKEGAQTILYGLLQREQKLIKGQLYMECKPYQLKSQIYTSVETSKKLWELSQKSFGIKFDI